jgi:hypothetical protein
LYIHRLLSLYTFVKKNPEGLRRIWVSGLHYSLSGLSGLLGLFGPSEITKPKTSHGINLLGLLGLLS